MHGQNFQDILETILPFVEMPTRYLGGEINSIKKERPLMDLTFALVFPDLYEIGSSHFGMQILYSILNHEPNIAAERFFTPAPDMGNRLRETGTPCLSLESKTPLGDFDVIGISLLYELNFTNILTLFELSGIPFTADERDNTFPLVIGGGPCTFNPEPLADFFDAFVVGDGEETILEISRTVIQFKKDGDGDKKTLLRMLSRIQGVYVPSFFIPEYDENGIQTLTPVFEDQTRIKRAILPSLEHAPFPLDPIVPFGKPVHDRLRLEVARGCSRGCRFCQAGMIYRPVRERAVESLLDITRTSLKKTGYKDISLLSLSTGDYSNLTPLMAALLAYDSAHCHSVSLPSIRAERLTPELMELIKTVRKTGFTIAPEAGSQRLRDVINKNLTESDIETTVENAFRLGWKNIKLYFMMGLPFETEEDMEAICRMARYLASSKAQGRKTVNVSIAPFIPKPHTPFERCSQIPLEQSLTYLQYLKDNLRHPKVKLKWQNPEMSVIEGVWSRGDRRLSSLLTAAYQNGCRLDGWSDHFRFDWWQEAFSQTGISPDFFTTRKRSDSESLPWRVIDCGISSEFLKNEYKRAKDRASTPDCRDGECTGCGICDFETIKVDVQPPLSCVPAQSTDKASTNNQDLFVKYELQFSKTGNARFFGHLEMANIIQRAIRRAGLTVKYSQGFNPNMKLAFDNPLPLGMESEAESFYLHLPPGTRDSDLIQKLNHELPEGLKISRAAIAVKKKAVVEKDSYVIRLITQEPTVEDIEQNIQQFLQKENLFIEDISRKGKKRRVDLRQAVEKINIIDRQNIEIVIKRNHQRTVRPSEILIQALCFPEEKVQTAIIKKKKQDH